MQNAGAMDPSYVSDIYNCHKLLTRLTGNHGNYEFVRDWKVTGEYKQLNPQVDKTRAEMKLEETTVYPLRHPLAAVFSFEDGRDCHEKSKKLLTSYHDFVFLSKTMFKIIGEHLDNPSNLEKAFHEAFVESSVPERQRLTRTWEFGDFGRVDSQCNGNGGFIVVNTSMANETTTHIAAVHNTARHLSVGLQQEAYNVFNKHINYLLKEAVPLLKKMAMAERRRPEADRSAKYLAPYIRMYTAILANNIRVFNNLRSSLSLEHTLQSL